MGNDKVQVVTGTIAATPAEVFAVLADPNRHTELDGSDMLRGAPAGEKPVTAVGDSFLMDMHQEGLGEYQMRNEILAFEAGRRIAWVPLPNRISPEIAELLGDIDPTGYHYAFDLEPTGEGHTAVTHTYDWNGVKDERALPFFPRVSADQMAQTIARLADAVAKPVG